MDIIKIKTHEKLNCKICKAKTSNKISFKDVIEVNIPVCEVCYDYTRYVHKETVQKHISSIKAIFGLNKKIKYWNAIK